MQPPARKIDSKTQRQPSLLSPAGPPPRLRDGARGAMGQLAVVRGLIPSGLLRLGSPKAPEVWSTEVWSIEPWENPMETMGEW